MAVDADDRVYVFNRSDHPMMVFERDGTFVTSWGDELFTRAHGLTIGPDGMLYCVDDDGHSVRRCTPGGELLATYGTPGQPAPLHGGQPFNRPTKVAFDPASGDLYISDGYGNARVHKFTVDGEHLFSWGEYGTDRGQFNLPHSVCTDQDGTVYVADRESHRVQIFDDRGTYLDQWNDLHRPCGLHVADGLVYIGQIVTELTVNADYPNLGCCREHPRSLRTAAGPARRRPSGRGAGPVHRPARAGGRLPRGHLRRRSLLGRVRQKAHPAARGPQLPQAGEGRLNRRLAPPSAPHAMVPHVADHARPLTRRDVRQDDSSERIRKR